MGFLFWAPFEQPGQYWKNFNSELLREKLSLFFEKYMYIFFQFIWDSIGISTFENSELRWLNGKLIKSAGSFKEKEKLLSKLYSTVPRSTLIQVYKKYKFDYELFGFNFNYVLKIAGYQNLSKSEESIKPWFY